MHDMQVLDDTARQKQRSDELYRRVLEERQKPVAAPARRTRVQFCHPSLLDFWALSSEQQQESERLESLRLVWRAVDLNAFLQYFQQQEVHHSLSAFRMTTQHLRNYMAHRRELAPVQPKGDVKFFVRTMEAWGFTRAEAGTILGFRDSVLAGEVFKGTLDIPEGEVDERLTIMTKLILDLDGMYDDDAMIKRWLDLQRTELGGKSPRELLISGKLEGLFKVRSLVRYEARR
jgi:hypothetical protein